MSEDQDKEKFDIKPKKWHHRHAKKIRVGFGLASLITLGYFCLAAILDIGFFTKHALSANPGDITGTIYLNGDESNPIEANKTVALSINGGAKTTVETNTSGQFTFTSSPLNAGDVVAIFLDDETEKASFIFLAQGASYMEGVVLVTNNVKLGHFNAGPITNSNLDIADNIADEDLGVSISAGSATFTTARQLWVRTDKTYTPGGSVYCDNILVSGTLSLGTNNLTADGDLMVSGSLSSSNDISVLGGSATGDGVITMASGIFLIDGDGDFGGATAWTFNNLTFGKSGDVQTTTKVGSGAINVAGVLTIATNQTLNAGASTWALSRTGTGTFVINGTFNSNSSTFEYTGGTAMVYVENTTYYNLRVNHADTTFRQDDTTRVNNVLTIQAGTYAAYGNTWLYGVGTPLVNNGAITTGGMVFCGDGAVTIPGGNYPYIYAGYEQTNLTANRTYTLGGDVTVSTQFVIGPVAGDYSAILDASDKTITLLNTGVNIFMKRANGIFEPGTSTVRFSNPGGDSTLGLGNYYNLELIPSSNATYALPYNTNISNSFTNGSGSNVVTTTVGAGGSPIIGTLINPVDSTLNFNNASLSFSGGVANSGTLALGGTTSVSFTATSSGKSIDTGGTVLPSTVFNGSGGEWLLERETTFTNLTVTNGKLIDNGKIVNVAGTLNIGSSGLLTSTGNWNFTSTASGKSITTSGESLPAVVFDGVGGEWTLQDNFSAASIQLSHGRLIDNTQTVTIAGDIIVDQVENILSSTGTWIQAANGSLVNSTLGSQNYPDTWYANKFKHLIIDTGVTSSLVADAYTEKLTLREGAVVSKPDDLFGISIHHPADDFITMAEGSSFSGGKIRVSLDPVRPVTYHKALSISTPIIIQLTALTESAKLSLTGDWQTGGLSIYGRLNSTSESAAVTLDTNGHNLTVNGDLSFGWGSEQYLNGYFGKLVLGSGTHTVTGNISVPQNSFGTQGFIDFGSSNTSIGGNVDLTSTTVTPGTATVHLTSTATGKLMTTDGQTLPNLEFNGEGGDWTLQDDLTASSITMTKGRLYDNARTVTVNGSIMLADVANLLTSTGNWIMAGSGSINNFVTDPNYVSNIFKNLTVKTGVAVDVDDYLNVRKITFEDSSTVTGKWLHIYPEESNYLTQGSNVNITTTTLRILKNLGEQNITLEQGRIDAPATILMLAYGTGVVHRMTANWTAGSVTVTGGGSDNTEAKATALDTNGYNLTVNGDLKLGLTRTGITNSFHAKLFLKSGTHRITGALQPYDGTTNATRGYVDFGSSTIYIGGNLILNNISKIGSATGTIILNGSSNQTFYNPSSIRLNNLKVENPTTAGVVFNDGLYLDGTFTNITPSSKMTFKSGAIYYFPTININGGSSSTKITMLSSSNGLRWYFTVPSATPTVSYVSVRDSSAIGGNTVNAHTGCTDLGGNVNWDFGYVPTPTPTPTLTVTTSPTETSTATATIEQTDTPTPTSTVSASTTVTATTTITPTPSSTQTSTGNAIDDPIVTSGDAIVIDIGGQEIILTENDEIKFYDKQPEFSGVTDPYADVYAEFKGKVVLNDKTKANDKGIWNLKVSENLPTGKYGLNLTFKSDGKILGSKSFNFEIARNYWLDALYITILLAILISVILLPNRIKAAKLAKGNTVRPTLPSSDTLK